MFNSYCYRKLKYTISTICRRRNHLLEDLNRKKEVKERKDYINSFIDVQEYSYVKWGSWKQVSSKCFECENILQLLIQEYSTNVRILYLKKREYIYTIE